MRTQQDINAYNGIQDRTPNIQSAIIELISKNGRWRGTSTELSDVLGLNINPRALSVQLKKLNGELENLLGISVTWDRKRDKRIVVIANNAEASQSEVTLRRTIQTTPQDNSFASRFEKEPVTFPFSWQYGTITRLSKKERTEVNRVRHQGRKKISKTMQQLVWSRGRFGI